MSLESKFINYVLAQGPKAYRQALKRGFRADWFRDPEMQRIWNHVVSTMEEFRTTPSPGEISRRFPHFPFAETAEVEHIDPMCNELRQNYMASSLDDLLDKVRVNRSNPEESVRYLADQLNSIRAITSPIEYTDFTASLEELEDEYDEVQNGKVFGLEYPWESLQRETMGMHRGELIFIYGRPKSMKTFTALTAAVHAYLFSGARVLIISREMSRRQMRKRIAALIAKVAYGPWKKAKLLPEELARVWEALYGLLEYEESHRSPWNSTMTPAIRIVGGHHKKYAGFELVDMLSNEFFPDLILDDSFYLISQSLHSRRGPMDPRVLQDQSQKAKSFAMDNQVVYMVTSQANRDSVKLSGKATEGIANTDGFAQDSDVILHNILVEGNPRRKMPRHIVIPTTLRDGDCDGLVIFAEPCINFDEMSIAEMKQFGINSEYLKKAQQQESGEDPDAPAGPTSSCDESESEIEPMLDAKAAPDIEPLRKKKTPRRNLNA